MELSKASDTKEFIAQTAFRVFLQKGYHGTAMSELVAESKLSKGAFYHYFPGKEALYRYVIAQYLNPVFEVANLEEIRHCNLKQTLSFLLSYYKEILKPFSHLLQENNARYYALFFEALQEVPEFRSSVQNFYKGLKNILAEKIETEQQLPKNKAEQQAIGYIARYEGIIFWTAIFPEDDGASLLDAIST